MQIGSRKGRRGWRRVFGFFVAIAVMAATPFGARADAYPRPGHTDLVSEIPGWYPSVSTDGRFVAWWADRESTVLVRDRLRGRTENVVLTVDGKRVPAGTVSGRIAMTPDARYVLFSSSAADLVPGYSRFGEWQLYARDRVTGTTEMISVASDETPGENKQWGNASSFPAITPDGRYVAFLSTATNLAPGGSQNSGSYQAFVRDRVAGVTERVSVSSTGASGNQGVDLFPIDISADGRYVTFSSPAVDLAPSDTNTQLDVFVRDRLTQTTHLASVSSDETQGNGQVGDSAISGDGRYIAFWSYASNLVPGDTNGTADLFVRDQHEGTTERVSVDSAGGERRVSTSYPSISHDGRFVAFSWATGIYPDPADNTNKVSDPEERIRQAAVHDRSTGSTWLVSVNDQGKLGNSAADGVSLSDDGRYVVFNSSSTNLVPEVTPGNHVYIRDLGPPLGVRNVKSVAVVDGVLVSGDARFAGTNISQAADDGSDVGAGGEAADLLAASLTFRPEEEDFVVDIDVAALPDASPLDGLPSMPRYGARFTMDGTAFEVMSRRSPERLRPVFELFECVTACVTRGRVGGGIGTTGHSVRFSIPMSKVAASPGSRLDDVEAFAFTVDPGSEERTLLDRVNLPDAAVPATRVDLGVARPGDDPQDVRFDTPAALSSGAFSGRIDAVPEGMEIWARACLGDVCRTARESSFERWKPAAPAYGRSGTLLVSNARSRDAGSISEADDPCDGLANGSEPPHGTAAGVDGRWFELPYDAQEGVSVFAGREAALFSSQDVDAWFYDAACQRITEDPHAYSMVNSDLGFVPRAAKYVVINLYRGRTGPVAYNTSFTLSIYHADQVLEWKEL